MFETENQFLKESRDENKQSFSCVEKFPHVNADLWVRYLQPGSESQRHTPLCSQCGSPPHPLFFLLNGPILIKQWCDVAALWLEDSCCIYWLLWGPDLLQQRGIYRSTDKEPLLVCLCLCVFALYPCETRLTVNPLAVETFFCSLLWF